MSSPIIHIENLSKLYRIGSREKTNRTFRETVSNIFTAPLRNFNRLRKLNKFNDSHLGQTDQSNQLNKLNQSNSSDTIGALKDVNFEVHPGEVVGIIGRNGAGKSTLLKILSRITEPSSGEIKLHGRVASLLEVGTGFHPELTGRENIYLNGSILGMRKFEIDQRFDEIVAFSEIEKFIDTPVKRYSSGMYVRLAFAVAAHLEHEILLVDEVLAVGDAAFQKKCMGKMKDVGNQGRTILFVSHNMSAIQILCKRTLLLDSGMIVFEGSPHDVIEHYMGKHIDSARLIELKYRNDRQGNGNLRIVQIKLESSTGINHCLAGNYARIVMKYEWVTKPLKLPVNMGFTLWTLTRQPVAECKTSHAASPVFLESPVGIVTCDLPTLPLVPGQYILDFCIKYSGEIFDWVENAMVITIEDSDYLNSSDMKSTIGATTLLKQQWESFPLKGK